MHTIKTLIFTIAVIFMTVIFSTFYFSESPWGNPAFQSDSEALVTRKIQTKISILEDLKQKGGFLYAEEKNVSAIIPGLYTSQVGLQGLILNTIDKLFQVEATRFIGISRIIVALLFSLTMASILYVTLNEFGIITSLTFFILVILSTWLVAFSKNLYWVAFTLFLPYAIGWLIYPLVIKSRIRFSTFLLIIGALVFLKSLNGYEYITNVLLGATVAPVYFELKRGTQVISLVRKIFWIGLAGVTGFFLAYLLHFVQLYVYLKDLYRAFYIITERATARTLGKNPYSCDTSGFFILTLKYLNIRSIYSTKIPLVWMFCTYLIGLAPIIPFRPGKSVAYIITLFGGSLVLFSIGIDWFAGRPGMGLSQLIIFSAGFFLIIYGIIYIFNIKIPSLDKLTPLTLTTTWALLSSLSWHVLAQNHMACHLGLNPIIFYLPFGVTVFIQIGYWLQIISSGVLKAINTQ
jgi:hypothetical protein